MIHYYFFKELASGEKNYAEAFNIADYHVAEENFFSIWIPIFYDISDSQNAKLDDNGNGVGHDYNLPYNGDGYLAGVTGL